MIMPMYEFARVDGSVIEVFFSMKDAPEVDSIIEHGGERLRRIASLGSSPPGSWKPYISNRLPRFLKGVECTRDGKPKIDSQATERRVASMLGWERD